MCSVVEMNFCECVRKLIRSVSLGVILCTHSCVCIVFVHAASNTKWTSITPVTAGGKCDLLRHSYCFIFFWVEDVKDYTASLFLLSVWPFIPILTSKTPLCFPQTLFRLPSVLDGHLIHLTNWKDKYSSVECEAHASPLTQTGDEGKVFLTAQLRWTHALKVSHSTKEEDTYTVHFYLENYA